MAMRTSYEYQVSDVAAGDIVDKSAAARRQTEIFAPFDDLSDVHQIAH